MRAIHFQRIVFIVVKSEEEEVQIVCEKGGKVLAESKFHTGEFLSYKQTQLKKPICDMVSHRQVGVIKFTVEKTKNASLPSNNPFWRVCNKSKHSTSSKLTLQI
jgi:hypothetical protein